MKRGVNSPGRKAGAAVVLACLFIGACGGSNTPSSQHTATVDRDDPNAVCQDHHSNIRQIVQTDNYGFLGVVCSNGIYYAME